MLTVSVRKLRRPDPRTLVLFVFLLAFLKLNRLSVCD